MSKAEWPFAATCSVTLVGWSRYSCDDSNGKPPFTGSQLEYNSAYAKPLGEPQRAELHSVAVRHVDGESDVREEVSACGCLVGDGMTAEGKPAPSAGPTADPLAGSCMEFDHSCEKCQGAIDQRCNGCPDGKAAKNCPWCGQSCVFLSDAPPESGGHHCLPHNNGAWINASNTCTKNCTAPGPGGGPCIVPPAPPPPRNPYVEAPSANTTSLWLGTTDLRPAAGLVYDLTAGTSICECVLSRRFASGARAYYNATTWKLNESEGDGAKVKSSSASCVLWADNTTLDNDGGCAEARAFFAYN